VVAHRAHPFDDRVRIVGRMRQGTVEVVDHGQPCGGHPGPFGGPFPLQLPRAALAEVVQVGQRPPPAVLELGYDGRVRGRFPFDPARRLPLVERGLGVLLAHRGLGLLLCSHGAA
jgi:hypothetical protein